MEINKLLIFDIYGKMAHFRKYYTNSSSLSYMFPPRTVITGLIAAVLGIERDTYYEEFSADKCHVAVSVRTPLRKIMQTVNYLQTKDMNGLNGSKGHTQIPLEIILPEEDMIVYRVYFAHEDEAIMEELSRHLKSGRVYYPIYLGISEFLAASKYIQQIDKNEIDMLRSGQQYQVSTVCNCSIIKDRGLIFSDSHGMTLQYIKEKMPLEFDKDRRIKSTASFIYEKNSKSITGIFDVPAYRINYDGLEENIVFMEGDQ
ncbi:MAG: type I-B CRISPR-associated protein Cas5b [Thermoanaerobacteraceae bacterium]|nr:type I-B CRISPR-associated protein Cas5b [Thermoanaerobacteraceae bacterium]